MIYFLNNIVLRKLDCYCEKDIFSFSILYSLNIL